MSLKVITVKNAWFATIDILIMSLKFKILFAYGYHDLKMLCINLSDILFSVCGYI